ncbi:hypothetical protein V5F72_19355 [Xanthobacter flavus]|uniref:hypothetical protein n=1 Tax=Xanthobacter flavus TaxID=281 RepID=UPI0037261AB8
MDGGFPFPGPGKNGFKFGSTSTEQQLQGSFWHVFLSNMAPDATVVLRPKV